LLEKLEAGGSEVYGGEEISKTCRRIEWSIIAKVNSGFFAWRWQLSSCGYCEGLMWSKGHTASWGNVTIDFIYFPFRKNLNPGVCQDLSHQWLLRQESMLVLAISSLQSAVCSQLSLLCLN
jgi:hypothetical protein